MTKKEFLNHFEELIEADPDTLTGNETLRELKKWDSLAIVGFIAMVDEKFGITLSAEKVQKSRTIPDLIGLLGDGITSGTIAV